MTSSMSRVHEWFAARSPWQRRGLAIGAGVLATLAHAPFQLTPLYAVAIVILVWLLDAAHLREKRVRAAFGVSLEEYLILVRVGPLSACRGILALISTESRVRSVELQMPVLESPLKKAA